MLPRQVPAPGPEAAGKVEHAPAELAAVHDAASGQVLRNALAHQIRHGAFLESRLGPECARLLLGQSDLHPNHDVKITDVRQRLLEPVNDRGESSVSGE